MPTNQAAWLTATRRPLEVKDAPYVAPGPGELLIKNHAVAINPVDWAIAFLGGLMFRWIKCPFVLGTDLAGEVVAVGSGVAGFKVGDRVLAMAAGMMQSHNRAAESAFQAYTIVLPRLTTILPDSVSYVDACVVPLGATTAACGLFQSDLLALQKPVARPMPRGQWVLIMGGATSVGCNAIQLAVAAGYSVVTTASAKNFALVRSLGAAQVFDYNSKTAVRDIVAALKDKDVVGAFAIGVGSAEVCLDILPKLKGRKFVANCSAPLPLGALAQGAPGALGLLRFLPALLLATLRVWRKSRRRGITVKFFDASSVADNEIGPAIYRDYLGPALVAGTFRPAPPARVVGRGLGDTQKAFDIQRQGVSATKIVVEVD
jgi:NADPH:quinone reductase-like Zn-dependent oxidoreductase